MVEDARAQSHLDELAVRRKGNTNSAPSKIKTFGRGEKHRLFGEDFRLVNELDTKQKIWRSLTNYLRLEIDRKLANRLSAMQYHLFLVLLQRLSIHV